MSDQPPAPVPPGGPRASRAWPIAFAVVAALLVAAVLYIVLDDDGDEPSPTPTPEAIAPPDCDAAALSGAIAASGAVEGSYTIEDSVCSPTITTGAGPRSYAWARARIDSPEPIEPANAFFVATAEPVETGAQTADVVWGDWQLLSLGTGETCDDVVGGTVTDDGGPVCDLFPDAPRGSTGD